MRQAPTNKDPNFFVPISPCLASLFVPGGKVEWEGWRALAQATIFTLPVAFFFSFLGKWRDDEASYGRGGGRTSSLVPNGGGGEQKYKIVVVVHYGTIPISVMLKVLPQGKAKKKKCVCGRSY